MTEDTGEENSQTKLINVITIVEEIQKKLELELKELSKSIDNQSQEVKNRGKSISKEGVAKITSTINNLKSQLEDLVNDQQANASEELLGLKESLDGQLDSLRGYANQVVEDEELKLVTTLETSLTNVTDITKDKSKELTDLISQITQIANKSTSAPFEIIQNANAEVKEDLSNSLAMEKEKLSKAINELQNEFRDKIGTQIEKVFMGVTLTKESINGIIRDTLSRLEENLNRLHVGIDENFTKEIGITQDMIHSYEGKLMDAIENTQQNYDSHMQEILEKHSKKTIKSLDDLKSQITSQKETILSEITDISKSQEENINHAISQLEGQIVNSKAEVIESHGVLKDDLGKLLQSNSDTVKQSIEKLQNNNQSTLSNLLESLTQFSTEESTEIINKFKNNRKEFEQSFDQFRKSANQRINQSQGYIKEFGSLIKKVRSKHDD